MKKWLILIALSLLPLWNLLPAGLPVTHDGQDHVARVANFYQSLAEGNIIPRWAANLNWGYGHPILMFLYPLPSYMASIFHWAGLTFVDSTKLVFGVSYVASIIAMYLFASYPWGTSAGILAALLYGFAPYRFVDLYVRGALGEHVAFIFPPLILLGLWRLSDGTGNKRLSALFVTFGMSGLLLSHNAVSLMMLPVIIAVIIYLSLLHKNNRWQFVVLSSMYLVFGFVLSAFFWLPALIEGKYTLRDIVINGDVSSRFVNFSDFFNPWWKYGGATEISKFLGFGHLIILLAAAFMIRQFPKSSKLLATGCLIFIAFSLFLMTKGATPVWEMITILQKFQFPWRLLHVTTFVLSVLSAVVVAHLEKRKRIWFVAFVCAVTIIASFPMWRAKMIRQYPESFFTGVYFGTTDTGESAPIWSVRFMEHEPKADMEVISGKADIVRGKRTGTYHAYTVSASTHAQFLENTLYFPNWEVFVDKVKVPVEYQDPHNRGLLTFETPSGVHTIEVIFNNTKLRNLANAVSLGGLALFIIYIGTMSIWRKKK